MFKTYEKYIFKNFINKFLIITLIFFSLIIILSVLEEISFFKNTDVNFMFPYLITVLGAPITLFEIFPFIFLISTQFLFYDLFKKDELTLLKTSGLNNLKIIKILFLISFFIGIFAVLFFYNAASKLKFYYTDIKNEYTKDNKYLAVVTDSGLWLKDEINNYTLIVKANYIQNDYLISVVINKFNNRFELEEVIQSKRINIKNDLWEIENPTITKKNITSNNEKILFFKTNFNKKKIKSLFSDMSTLNLIELFDLKKDYENLGYSSKEIQIHLLNLFSTPIFYAALTVLSSIIMFNLNKNRSLFFHIIFGVFMSVIIYYINFIFNSLGNNEKIPAMASIFIPLIAISILTGIGLIKINEK